jgi:hypothetical protein
MNTLLHPMTTQPLFGTDTGGGVVLVVEYRTGPRGTQSSHLHLPAILPVIRAALGCRDVFRGSLNFHAPAAVAFPAPATMRCGGDVWLFVGAVVEGAAVGIAARRPPPELTAVIEVFACEQIAPCFGLQDGRTVEIRLLPAVHLTPVLQAACN